MYTIILFIIVWRMNKHKCDIDFEKHTPLMHLKLLVKKKKKKKGNTIQQISDNRLIQYAICSESRFRLRLSLLYKFSCIYECTVVYTTTPIIPVKSSEAKQ